MAKYYLTEDHTDNGIEWVIEKDAPNSGVVMGTSKSYIGAYMFMDWLLKNDSINIISIS